MESNWPEAHPTEKYLDMMNKPEKRIVFWCQHMNLPTGASELTKFDLRWLKYYHWEDKEDGRYIVTDDENPESFKLATLPQYAIIDPGGFAETKMIKKGSNNAIIIGGQPRDSIKKFVTFAFAGKMKEPSVFRDMVFEKHAEFTPRAWRIEVFGQQGYIYKDLGEEAQKRKKVLPLSECPKDVGADAKDLRIQGLMPVMENEEIYVHRSMRKLIAEIASYPGGLSLDLLDCLGWLNQLYWSRKKISDLSTQYRKDYRRYLDSRSSATGY